MPKARYIGLRLLQTVPSLIAVSIVSFALLRLAPGDPARVLAGPRASAATITAIRRAMGLDQPVYVQYGDYVRHALAGDFGSDLTGSQTVGSVITSGATVTLWLAVASLILTAVISLTLAVIAARRPDGIADTLIRGFSVGGMALPSFWVAVMLLMYLALRTGWFPIGGWPQGFGDRVNAIFLPALTMAISLAPILVRSLRSSLIEVLGSDYVLAARSAGVRGPRLLFSYVLRNALLPSIPLLAIIIGYLLGGSVIVESAYNLPGLGESLVHAVVTQDANVVQGITLFLGTLILLVYLLADVAVSLVDPRVRLT